MAGASVHNRQNIADIGRTNRAPFLSLCRKNFGEKKSISAFLKNSQFCTPVNTPHAPFKGTNSHKKTVNKPKNNYIG